jgi:DNA-binding beta-propeller fold protein YncE
MLALIYLGLAVHLGDQLCRRFFRFVSVAQRCASAVLVGLLVSTWFTYLAAWVFGRTQRPMLWGDLCFLALSVCCIWIFRRQARRGISPQAQFILPRVRGSALWDWITLLLFLCMACWMMFATLDYKNGTLLIGNNEWSDFGPNTAIIQSFAVGHNFPTRYPHFSGETIRYHFLFYFQAGNLTFLGLSLPWSLNLLSIITLVSTLALLMALGQLLFHSRTVGRIGAALFFFHGTLSFISFFRSQPSITAAFHAILGLKDFLPSGYPYRGELWGIWTQVVYLNQRHFASAVGILLVVLLFLLDRYRQHAAAEAAVAPPPDPLPPGRAAEENVDLPSTSPIEAQVVLPVEPFPAAADSKQGPPLSTRLKELISRVVVFDKSFVFAGCLLGLLPFWNALVFTACFAILAALFLLFPCRRQMVGLGLTTALVALPQLIILRSGGVKTATHSILRWGYIIEPPTLDNVIRYIGFSFGLKWALILIALAFATWFQRKLFLALCTMYVMTFCLEMSLETLANHKYLNIWLIISNLFAGYGVWRLWKVRPAWLAFATRPVALVVTGGIVLAGAIDLVPIHNSYFIQLKYGGDPLVKWVRENTKPHDIFLSDRFVNHQILLAGRRLFYGWPSFSWGAGYDTTQRDEDYRQLFENTDPYAVLRLLYKHKIGYVAIDEGVRHNEFIKRPNEELYALNFPKVWEDKANQYGGLVIYKVPVPPPKDMKRPDPARLQALLMQNPPVTMFQGGKGAGRGQFDFPRGVAVDATGNVLVSDTNNGRIQKFTAGGVYLSVFGSVGRNSGQFREPNGLAVDSRGNIYVADVANHRVQKLAADGRFLAAWNGPAPGFYGPRDVWVSADDFVYVVDQGRARIVKFDVNGSIQATWGSFGSGDGQFDEPTAVAVDAKRDRVYVADPHNHRIQVFDTKGKFLTKWAVKEWQTAGWSFQDLAVDPETERLYAVSPATDEVLIYDFAGTRVGALKPEPPNNLEGASALALSKGKLYVVCSFADRVRQLDLRGK